MTGSGPDGAVALVGLSGTGKSTVAPRLAQRCGGRSVDLDECLVERLGASTDQIFRRDGEAAFRRAERLELERVLDAAALDVGTLVLATGGGVVLDERNRRALRRCTVVWLRASVDELVARLSDTQESRPLLAGDARAALGRLESERTALYEEVADIVIDVDGVEIEDVVERVAAMLTERR